MEGFTVVPQRAVVTDSQKGDKLLEPEYRIISIDVLSKARSSDGEEFDICWPFDSTNSLNKRLIDEINKIAELSRDKVKKEIVKRFKVPENNITFSDGE